MAPLPIAPSPLNFPPTLARTATTAEFIVAPPPPPADVVTNYPTLAWTSDRGSVTGIAGAAEISGPWVTEFETNRCRWTPNTRSALATNALGQIYTQHLGGAYTAVDSFQVTLATTNRFWRAFAR